MGSTMRFWLGIVAAFILISLTISLETRTTADLNLEVHKGENDKYYKAQMSDDDFVGMYQKWFDTGLSSLFSAVANKKLKRKRRSVAKKFGLCSADATTIPKHARCLSQLLKDEIKDDHKPVKTKPRLDKYRGKSKDQGWTGGFRTNSKTRSKRSPMIKRIESYNLNSNKEAMTPLGSIAKMVLESVKKQTNKTDLPSWQETIQKLKLNGAKRKKIRKEFEEDSEESMSHIAMRGLKEKMLGNNQKEKFGQDIDAQELIDDPKKLEKLLKYRKNNKKMKPEEKVLDLIRQATKIAYALAGQNVTNFDNKTLKLVSPRFLGINKEVVEDDEISLVSPSLFSLHSEGVGIENLTSIPNILKGAGLSDQQIWLDVIMEAAGVNEESEKLEGEVKDFEYQKTRNLMTNFTSMVDEDGTPLYVTKKNLTELGGDLNMVNMFEALHETYSKEQLREMNTTGYTILSKEQIQMVYGPGSPANDSDALNRFMNLTKEEAIDNLHDNVHHIAEMKKFELRQKDIVLSPVLFTPAILAPGLASQPFILSPILFTPLILSPSVFGVVVLSPWMFVPLVLSPRVLGALILSPFVLSPVILTPLALHPAVLSPGIFNPLVLTPLLMVPFILSPQVFTPIILSPLCMSPVLLNPMVGSPLILSPFVLSPIIYSPMALSALILSPYALSPVLFSPLIAFAAVLSPSWLS